MEKTWRDAIKRVLSEEGRSLHYSDIAEAILTKGYYATDGATPAATVNAQISSSIKHDGDKSPFLRVGRGEFTLKEGVCSTPKSLQENTATLSVADDEEPSTSIIRAFGMYWQRDAVIWSAQPKVYGQSQPNTKAVDFGEQQGIYLLYDQHRIIYIGRTTDRSLGRRLSEHTRDRLNGRWDRFSWFGLLDVTQEGTLHQQPFTAALSNFSATLEAILIETLEPPLNRRRGDDLASVEFFQTRDPELKERDIQNTLRDIEQRLRGNA